MYEVFFAQFQHEIKKSEAGKKGSKLQKVEIWISIDVIKVVNIKNKVRNFFTINANSEVSAFFARGCLPRKGAVASNEHVSREE